MPTEYVTCEPLVVPERAANRTSPEAEGTVGDNTLQVGEEDCLDLLDDANDIIQSVGPDGRFLYVNRAWRETLGYTQEESTQLSLLEVIHPDSRAHCMEAFQRVMSGESVDCVEAAFVTKEGKRITVEGSANCRFVEGRPVATRAVFRDITERKRMEQELEEYRLQLEELVEERTAALGLAERRATTDELTGLFNHRYFHGRLAEEIARCSRSGDVFSLIFLDVDHFKDYNDAYGHLAGDAVLRQFGGVISQCIRDADLAFRYGGDEFAVLLRGTRIVGASKMAERIRGAVEAQIGPLLKPQSCSVGVASWPTDGATLEDIIQSADTSLYRAKQTGRNKICLPRETGPTEGGTTGASSDSQNRNAILGS